MTHVAVKDFGPIAEASVELKPLTVFIGPNNSGKSYLALTVYCLSRALFGDASSISMGRMHRGYYLWREFPPELVERASQELKKTWPTAESRIGGPIKISDLSNEMQDVLVEAARSSAHSLSRSVGIELQRCYGTEIHGLVRRGSALSAPQLEVGISEPDGSFQWEMQVTDQDLATKNWTVNLLDHSINNMNNRDVGLPIGLLVDIPDEFLRIATLELVWPILRNLIGEAHYMPASRSGILQGHKTLASLIVGSASRAWLQPMEIPRLAGVVTDLIQSLLSLDPNRAVENPAHQVAEFLEREVTRGSVDLDRRVEYPEIYYENDNGKFLLHQVSSMVSEVAPIVLFLKYLVRPGQLFIIEEPESHLDTDNQRKLARAIAMLVNSGVKVLITTHSDFFVNQINNLLLLSQISSRSRAARKYSANEVLDPYNVGAYLFRNGEDGSRVETLEVTANSGIPTFPFTDAHSALYNEAIRLEHSSR